MVLEEIVLNAATCLGEIGKKVAAESLELETISTLILLEEIGKLAAERLLRRSPQFNSAFHRRNRKTIFKERTSLRLFCSASGHLRPYEFRLRKIF